MKTTYNYEGSVQQKNTQQDTSISSLQAKLEKALFLENPNA